MNSHPIFTRFIDKKMLFLVYGPAATGKTHLAYHAYAIAGSRGLNPVFIATEPGTITFLEHMGIDYIVARSMDEVSRLAAEAAFQGSYIIVDSINWHYREAPGLDAARHLAFTSAMIASSGGFATAQVSMEESRPSGEPYIVHWAHALGGTARRDGVFELRLVRPIEKILVFRLEGGRVVWA